MKKESVWIYFRCIGARGDRIQGPEPKLREGPLKPTRHWVKSREGERENSIVCGEAKISLATGVCGIENVFFESRAMAERRRGKKATDTRHRIKRGESGEKGSRIGKGGPPTIYFWQWALTLSSETSWYNVWSKLESRLYPSLDKLYKSERRKYSRKILNFPW